MQIKNRVKLENNFNGEGVGGVSNWNARVYNALIGGLRLCLRPSRQAHKLVLKQVSEELKSEFRSKLDGALVGSFPVPPQQ